MTKTNRIIFKIASILSLISAILTLFIAMALFFNIKFVSDIYYELYVSSIDSLEININFYKLISIINLGFSTILNRYCYKVYSSISKMSTTVKFGNLNSLFSLSLFQMLLGSTFLPAIFCIIGVLIYNSNVKKVISKTPSDLKTRPAMTKAVLKEVPSNTQVLKNATIINIPQEVLYSMAEEINKIKNELKEGLITQEEYMKRLNRILEGKN